MPNPQRFKIDRVVIENYRSIRHCDVTLGDLTFLVGRNGSGKSSFLDALQFVQATVKKGLQPAVNERNGLSTILHRPARLPNQLKFGLWLSSPESLQASFEFSIEARSWTDYSVIHEACRVQESPGRLSEYDVAAGQLSGAVAVKQPASPEHALYISAQGEQGEFGAVRKLLNELQVSTYSSKAIHLLLLNRFPQSYKFATEVKSLMEKFPETWRVVEDYLRLIIPYFARLEVTTSGGRDWVAFVEVVNGSEESFYVPQVSDGTLYATQMMIDLFLRGRDAENSFPMLVEEPGASLHPWAIGVLRDALLEASRSRQVIVTTHSPDLLDDLSIVPGFVRTVHRNATGTQIEGLSNGAAALIDEGLATAGELFRRGVLHSDTEPDFAAPNGA